MLYYLWHNCFYDCSGVVVQVRTKLKNIHSLVSRTFCSKLLQSNRDIEIIIEPDVRRRSYLSIIRKSKALQSPSKGSLGEEDEDLTRDTRRNSRRSQLLTTLTTKTTTTTVTSTTIDEY